ncbi:MAG TPA: hypothetical protein VE617_02490 [Propionibacteriaceae bacterium]|jgi:hypothetical protein|nr:hypothetical protein [Propionibacteriaceae bacterium]
MEPTTVTSIVMIVFAAGMIFVGLRNLFGAWEPIVRRTPVSEEEVEIQAAVREMRRAIADYERSQQSR